MRKRLLAALLALTVLFAAASCAPTLAATDASQATAQTAVYRKISAEEAHAIMQKDKGYILLDVRSQEEYDEAHIPGAVLLPDTQVADKAALVLPDKNAEILVYCRSGRRSAGAAQLLVSMGYTNVYDFGGIMDWPYDTVR